MDGLDRLVEMLEKRFGKGWADLLLFITVLGAAAWGIHTFIVYFLLPAIRVLLEIYNAVSGIHVALPKELPRYMQIITTAVFIVFSVLISIYIQQALHIRLRMIRLEDRLLSQVKNQDGIIGQLQEREVGYVAKIAELNRKIIELEGCVKG